MGVALDKATKGISGPHIPYEPSLGRDSLVHYRYGGFHRLNLQTNIGRIVGAIHDSDGRLIPDQRDSPIWPVDDPFRKAGISTWTRRFESLLRKRYLRVDQLFESRKGLHSVGLDLASGPMQLIVIKEAHRGVAVDRDGIDAKHRLLNEAAMLTRLQTYKFVPKLIDCWKEDERSFLVYDFIQGTTLASLIGQLANEGATVQSETIRKWALELCEILGELHAHNIVFADLKPSNIIVDGDGKLHIVDFELAHDLGDPLYQGFGTRGYCSPSQFAGAAPVSTQDDIYSLGATLLSAVTMMDLSLLPAHLSYARLLARHESHLPRALGGAIARCLEPDASKRLTLEEFIAAVRTSPTVCSKAEPASPRVFTDGVSYLSLARTIGDALCGEGCTATNGLYWTTRHHTSYGAAARDLYVGSSGVGLFLLELYDATRDDHYLRVAQKAAEWLQSSNACIGRSEPLPGLYFGEAGVGLFYLRLFLVTQQSKYLQWVTQASEAISDVQFQNPDLLTGAAGTGLFHIFCHYATSEERFLVKAEDAAEFLISGKSEKPFGWKIPPGYEGLSGNIYLGFSHGAAGIAYFFSELYGATQKEQYIDAAIEVAEWLAALSEPALDDGSGIAWPDVEGGKKSIHWCHGSAGIGMFFLKLFEASGNERFLNLACRAGKTIAEGGKWAGTTQCHGLAGYIELLVDLHQTTGDVQFKEWATELGDLLAEYGVPDSNYYRWQSESPDIVSSDFMVGEAGIGACFLRLADIGRRHPLSSKAFRADSGSMAGA